MAEALSSLSVVWQGLGIGIGFVSLALFFGFLDRVINKRRGDDAENRADREERRKDIDAARKHGWEQTQKLESCMQDKADVWSAAYRMENIAHDIRHAGNNAMFAAFQAGRREALGEPAGSMPPPLPVVPPLRSLLPTRNID